MVPCQFLGLCHDQDVVYVDNQMHSQLSQLSSEWLQDLGEDPGIHVMKDLLYEQKIVINLKSLVKQICLFRNTSRWIRAHARPNGRHLNLYVLSLKENLRKALSFSWIGIMKVYASFRSTFVI